MSDDIVVGGGTGRQNFGAFVERLAPGDEMRAWLDVLPAEKRNWALRCMVSASAGGVGRLNIDPGTYAVLLRAEILTIAELTRRIGPRRIARLRNAVAAYRRDSA